MEKILIVDDEPLILDGLKRQLNKRYEVQTATNGEKGLQLIASEGPFAIVVSAMRMPVMDGVTFLTHIRHIAPETVRIMLTGHSDQRTASEAINRGEIFRLLLKPCSHRDLILTFDAALDQYHQSKSKRELLDKTLKQYKLLISNIRDIVLFSNRDNGLILEANDAAVNAYGYSHQELLTLSISDLRAVDSQTEVDSQMAESDIHGILLQTIHRRKDSSVFPVEVSSQGATIGGVRTLVSVVRDITSRRKTEEDLNIAIEKLRKNLSSVIRALLLTVETRDPYTAGHQRRVSKLSRSIAQELGLPKETVENIRMAGMIHDLGKICVPAEILSKPTRLTDIEISLIKVHPQVGYNILKEAKLPYPIAEIVYQHHERLNGSGYPRGLKGDEILKEAQILSVADVIEAIASHRPYREAMGIDVALDEIAHHKGIFYDPVIVDASLRLFREKGFIL